MGDNEVRLPRVWKSYLYQLQQEAPQPFPVLFTGQLASQPEYLGLEYHGNISHTKTLELLTTDGFYLVRDSSQCKGFHILSLRCNNDVKHFRLYYDGQFYVGENKFDHLRDLVADGLITMYLEHKAGDYIHFMWQAARYEQSPYFALNDSKRRTLTRDQQPVAQKISTNVALNNSTDSYSYAKSHTFRVQTFKGLNWCDFCGNFMWGLIAQGSRCEDCGFVAHRKCSENVPSDCCPDLVLIRGVFGIDLTTLSKAHNTRVPFVVSLCVEEIEKRGLDSEGIYRVSGMKDDMEALRLAIDRDGEKTDLSLWDDINIIAGVLKLYFRLLPIPLIAFHAYPAMMAAAKELDEAKSIERLKEALKLLPAAHYNTFHFLMSHLHKVTLHHSSNKMSSVALSTVFCPSLYPAPELSNQVHGLPGLQLESKALELLIRHPESCFSLRVTSDVRQERTHSFAGCFYLYNMRLYNLT